MHNMAKYPHLSRSGKGGNWRYRRSVPAKLRPIIGKREFLMSFGTSVLEDALPQYHFIAAETDKELELAQGELDWREDDAAAQADGGYTIINRLIPDILAGREIGPEAQCRHHYLDLQERERNFRSEITKRLTLDPDAFWRGEFIALPMSREQFYELPDFAYLKETGAGAGFLLAVAYRKRLERRLAQLRGMLATQDFQALGIALSCCTGCAQKMGLVFAQTEVRFINDVLADDAILLPTIIDVNEALKRLSDIEDLQPAAVENDLKLSKVVEEWIAEASGGASAWSEERAALCRRVMQDFIQICGDKPIGVYRKSDGRAFVGLLRQLPANLDKLQSRLGVVTRDLRKIAEVAAAQGLEPQDYATTNKKIGIVHQCFSWILARYDECLTNPIEGMKVALRRSTREQKDAFATKQLNAIFAAPVFIGCRSEVHWSKPGAEVLSNSAKFWVPLIALFSGMRSGEICQLTQKHVHTHEGVYYFALTKDLRLKNDSSIRSVPIHKVLIDCGFLRFVASCHDRLFPDLPEHRSGRLSDAFGKHFARFLKSLGIKTDRTDFHSFRHNFVAAAEASGMDFAARERIVGHTLQGQAGRYGRRYHQEQQDMQLLLTRNIELQKLEFPGLRLDHLTY